MIQVLSPASDLKGGGPNHENAGVILVVEDVFVRNFLRATLGRQGYHVICAEVADALVFLRERGGRVDLLITNMPLDFAEFGDMPVLYLAAVPDPAAVQAFRQCVTLRKPFHPSQLLGHVAQLIR
jgi:hypothetical protein